MTFINPDRADLLATIGLKKNISGADGSYLYDTEGNRYFDCHSQYGAVPFGYNDQKLKEIILCFFNDKLPAMVQPISNPIAESLAERLTKLAPGKMRYVTYVNSGAEAVEAAVKVAISKTGRKKLIALKSGFHGKTRAALTLTHTPDYSEPFYAGDRANNVVHIQAGDLETLENHLKTREYAAFFVEPIQGEGGMQVPPQGFLKQAEALCKAYKTLFVVDEVQTGLGRTGRLFACEHEGLEPDILLLAKALGGGVVPLGAVLMTKDVWNSDYGLNHSSTFANNGFTCHVGNAVLDRLTENDCQLLGEIVEKGRYLRERLLGLVEKYPNAFSGVSGRGLMHGLSLKAWRGNYFFNYLSKTGLIVPFVSGYLFNCHKIYTVPTTTQSNVLRIAPSLTISFEQIDSILDALHDVGEQLNSGNYFRLLKYAFETDVSSVIRKDAIYEAREMVVENIDKLGRFAFLIHPTSEEDIISGLKSSFKNIPDDLINELLLWADKLSSKQMTSADVFYLPRLETKRGGFVDGYLIFAPFTPRQMLRMSAKDRIKLMNAYIDAAKKVDANVVGLGAFTSIISKGGEMVADAGPVITSGNSLTALTAFHGVKQVLAMQGKSLSDTHVAVIGAYGSVGRISSLKLAEECREISLIGNPNNASSTRLLQILAGEIIQQALQSVQGNLLKRQGTLVDGLIKNELLCRKESSDEDFISLYSAFDAFWTKNPSERFIHISTDIRLLANRWDAVISATSQGESFIDPSHFKLNAVICDVARPSDLLSSLNGERDDLICFEGSLLKLPEKVRFGEENLQGFPTGVGLACLSETIVLAMSQVKRNYSIGSRMSLADAEWIYEESVAHGFEVYLNLPVAMSVTSHRVDEAVYA